MRAAQHAPETGCRLLGSAFPFRVALSACAVFTHCDPLGVDYLSGAPHAAAGFEPARDRSNALLGRARLPVLPGRDMVIIIMRRFDPLTFLQGACNPLFLSEIVFHFPVSETYRSAVVAPLFTFMPTAFNRIAPPKTATHLFIGSLIRPITAKLPSINH